MAEESTSNTFFTKEIKYRHTEFYLSEEITKPSDYAEWFNIIRTATEDDSIYFHINSYGGNLNTAIQFLRCMAECEAEITCSIEGECLSAATLIFLAGDVMEISNNSTFMVHNYTSGYYGKGNELYANAVFSQAWSIAIMQEVYKDFLLEEEIAALLEGKDFWFNAEEVTRRLLYRAEKVKERNTALESEVKK